LLKVQNFLNESSEYTHEKAKYCRDFAGYTLDYVMKVAAAVPFGQEAAEMVGMVDAFNSARDTYTRKPEQLAYFSALLIQRNITRKHVAEKTTKSSGFGTQ